MKNTIKSPSGNTAQLQRASDGYPFQFPHFTETVWIKHPNPTQLTVAQMEAHAFQYLESEILYPAVDDTPTETPGGVTATLNDLPIGVSMGYDSIVVKISFKDYTDEECTTLSNFRELHDEIHTVFRRAIDDLGREKNPNDVYTVFIGSLLPALVPTGVDYSIKEKEVPNA